jgi:hypothetical protein
MCVPCVLLRDFGALVLWVNLHVLNLFLLKWSTSKLTTIGPAYPDPMVIMHCPYLMVLIHFKNLGLRPSGEFICSWLLFSRVVSVGVDHILVILMVPIFYSKSMVDVTSRLRPSVILHVLGFFSPEWSTSELIASTQP